jgi:hypothetical protein
MGDRVTAFSEFIPQCCNAGLNSTCRQVYASQESLSISEFEFKTIDRTARVGKSGQEKAAPDYAQDRGKKRMLRSKKNQ